MDRRWPTAGPASGRSGVVTAMAPMATPSRSTTTTVSPRPRTCAITSVRSGSGSSAGDQAADPYRVAGPTVPVTPTPGSERTSDAVPTGRPADGRRGDGRGDGMLALRLHGGGQGQHLVGADTGGGGHRRDLGVALGEGTGLVEDHRVHLGQPLEHVAAADEDAQGRGPAAPHHHGHRRGQAHGAGTGHQQHGQTAQDGLARRCRPPATRPGRSPAAPSSTSGHEDAADPVGQALERGLVPLGVVHQPLQPGQHRLGGHRADPDHQDAARRCGCPR